jgi:hypothetical protein
LVTLGDTTEIGSFQFFVVPSKVAKASKEDIIAGIFMGIIELSIQESLTDREGSAQLSKLV